MTQADPVQTQVEAYNRRDLDAFLACYAPDVEVRLGNGRVLMHGHEQMRPAYERLFAEHPDLHAEIPTRIRAGEWTVDEEKVRMGDQEIHLAVAYQVEGGRIRSVVLLRSDRPSPES